MHRRWGFWWETKCMIAFWEVRRFFIDLLELNSSAPCVYITAKYIFVRVLPSEIRYQHYENSVTPHSAHINVWRNIITISPYKAGKTTKEYDHIHIIMFYLQGVRCLISFKLQFTCIPRFLYNDGAFCCLFRRLINSSFHRSRSEHHYNKPCSNKYWN